MCNTEDILLLAPIKSINPLTLILRQGARDDYYKTIVEDAL